VGFIGVSNENQFNLGIGCFALQTIKHEMMHRIGFIHRTTKSKVIAHAQWLSVGSSFYTFPFQHCYAFLSKKPSINVKI
jgi:hypothetical protein